MYNIINQLEFQQNVKKYCYTKIFKYQTWSETMENENIPETLDNYYILNDDGSKSEAYTLDELAMLKANGIITKDTLVIKNGEDPKPAGAFLNFYNDDTINTSGTGKSARLPKELNTYNVGAGILSIFWGYIHFPKYRLYWGIFIVLFLSTSFFFYYLLHAHTGNPLKAEDTIAIIIVTISAVILVITMITWFIMTITFFTKGNEIAWKNRKFKDIEQFKDIQRKWNIWGYTIFILLFIFINISPLLMEL